jgi:hypothetical protein
MKRALLSFVTAFLLAVLLGARGPAHGAAAAALSQAGERASTACENASTAGAAAHHAGLVVVFDGGRTETQCIEFTEDQITGAELLQRSGLEIVFSSGGLGSGICKIEGTGCNDPGDCFCQCRGADCAYWSYWTLHDGAWRYQQLGASQRELYDGDVDAWVWGNGRSAPTRDGGVCPSPTPSPARAQPTPTVVPRPTSQGAPTSGAGASPTARAAATTIGASETAIETRPSETPGHVVRGTTPASTRRSDVSDASNDGGSGAPVGLIAFGVVAGALVIALGGLIAWRRFGG